MVIGELCIACSTTVGKYILPRLISGFGQRYPEVGISVNVLGRRTAVEWLLEGRSEVAVVSTCVNQRDLEFRTFLEDELTLIVPTDHPWADGRAVTPADLVKVPLIMREPTAGSYQVLVEALLRHNLSVSELRVALTLGNAEAIEMAVEAGIGAAVVSKLVAARGVALGCIKEVPITGMSLKRDICIVRNTRRAASPPQQAFWNFAFDPANAPLRQLTAMVA